MNTSIPSNTNTRFTVPPRPTSTATAATTPFSFVTSHNSAAASPQQVSIPVGHNSPSSNRAVSETTYEYTATTSVNGNPVTARVRTMPISTAILELEEGDAYGDSMSSILQQLLSPNILRNFLDQSVEVAPTQTQLETASTLFHAEQKEDDNCAICQDTMEEEQHLRRLNHCHHTFHKSCVDTWFRTNVHCPTCRHDIRDTTSTHVPPPVPPNHRRTNIHDPQDD
jgi:hypothetical protein